MENILVPIFVPLSLFALIFGIVYLQKKENLAMIEKNMNPREDRPAPYRNLKWGLLLVGAGLGLLLAFLISNSGWIKLRDDDEFAALYFALIGIGGGIGLILSYKIEKKEILDKPGE